MRLKTDFQRLPILKLNNDEDVAIFHRIDPDRPGIDPGMPGIDFEFFFYYTAPVDTFLIDSVKNCQSKVFLLIDSLE